MIPCNDPLPAFHWPDHLQEALDGALPYAEGHDQATIENAVASEMAQLWAANESFCLTELKVSPTNVKTAHLWLAGGRIEELEGLLPIIEGWAKDQGCKGITMLGRRGWERSFFCHSAGYHPVMTFYAKELV